jgi:20S proteasome alpha/beta subunit
VTPDPLPSRIPHTTTTHTQSLGETATAIGPKALALLVSHLLYFRFRGAGAAPIIAGLDEEDNPVLCTQGGCVRGVVCWGGPTNRGSVSERLS